MQQTRSSPKRKKIAPWIFGITIIMTVVSTAIIYSKTRDTASDDLKERSVLSEA